MGKSIEHKSIYGFDLSDDENSEAMMKMLANLQAEVITQGVSMIHAEFAKFLNFSRTHLKR